MGNVAALGAKIVVYLLVAGKWIILITTLGDCLKRIAHGDRQGIFKEAMNAIMAYGSLFLLQWGLNEVDKAFA